jgi:hypothetical protein
VLLARIVIRGLGPRSRRSPFALMQIRLGAALLWTVAAYRLLQTGFEVRAHPSSANILTRIGSTRPSRGSSFSCVGEPFGSGAEARAPVFAMSQFDSNRGANLYYPGVFSLRKNRFRSRSGSTESSEGLAHGERPSSASPSDILCRQSAAAKELESLPPRRASLLLLRGVMLGLSG